MSHLKLATVNGRPVIRNHLGKLQYAEGIHEALESGAAPIPKKPPLSLMHQDLTQYLMQEKAFHDYEASIRPGPYEHALPNESREQMMERLNRQIDAAAGVTATPAGLNAQEPFLDGPEYA